MAAILVENRQSGGEDWCYHEKFQNFCSVGGIGSINSICQVFRYPSTILCTAYRKKVLLRRFVV